MKIIDFSQLFNIFNAILSWISNSLLIYLIVKKSPKSMENYKYLMLIFSTFGLIFGWVDITNQPMLHLYQGAYVIFSKNPLGLPRNVAFLYIALNCSCYGMVLLLLTFHFVYRYLAVCRVQYLKFFSYPLGFIPATIFTVVVLEWWILAFLITGESEIVENYIRETMLQTYGLTKQDYIYASSLFYRKNETNGEEHFSIPDLAFVFNISFIIVSGFSVIFFCWLNIRARLLESARHQNHSKRTLEMQRELLQALVVQTLLPIVLMFFPASIILIFPIFRIEIGHFEVIILSLITTEPFVDSLVPMYFIKEYRLAISKFLRRKCENLRGIATEGQTQSTRTLFQGNFRGNL